MKKKLENREAGPKTIDELSQKETIAHYNAVMIEELRSQFKFVIEKSEGVEERTRQLINELHQKTEERFDDVDLVLRKHSEMFVQVDQRFDRLVKKVDGHDQRFESLEHKFDRLEKKVDGHDQRFDTLERKMDEVVEIVQRHEKDIQELKRAV